MATFFNAFRKMLKINALRSFFLRFFYEDTIFFLNPAEICLPSLISCWSNQSNKWRLALIGFRTENSISTKCFFAIFVQGSQVKKSKISWNRDYLGSKLSRSRFISLPWSIVKEFSMKVNYSRSKIPFDLVCLNLLCHTYSEGW